MNNILIEIGGIKIYWYSVTMVIAILFSTYFTYKDLKKTGFKNDDFIDLSFYTIIIALIGARLYYVLFNLDYYLNEPLNIIKVWEGGLAIHGGLFAGILYIMYYAKKHKFSMFRITDIVAPYILISQSIGRWGNFFNQEAHGVITTAKFLRKLFIPNFIIEGMTINSIVYHPTFLYESVYNLFGAMVLLIFKKKYKKNKKGMLTGMYFMWYSFGRFFIESMRTDSLMLGNIRVAMLISVLLFVGGTYLVFRKDIYEK